MADSTGSNNSLDDFFKKKDKSRKSKGRKPILPVAPPESTEDPDKFPDEEPQTTVATKEPVINIKLGDEDDGEWKEFEEEKDYSGLRIQAMTIKDKEEEKERERQQEIQEQENKKSEGQSGPWKVAGTNASDASTDETKSETNVTSNSETKPIESTSSESQVTPSEPAKTYVPPGMRNRIAAGGGGGGGSGGGSGTGGITNLQPAKLSSFVRKAKAPEIESQQEFPSLGAEGKAASINNSNSWRANTKR